MNKTIKLITNKHSLVIRNRKKEKRIIESAISKAHSPKVSTPKCVLKMSPGSNGPVLIHMRTLYELIDDGFITLEELFDEQLVFKNYNIREGLFYNRDESKCEYINKKYNTFELIKDGITNKEINNCYISLKESYVLNLLIYVSTVEIEAEKISKDEIMELAKENYNDCIVIPKFTSKDGNEFYLTDNIGMMLRCGRLNAHTKNINYTTSITLNDYINNIDLKEKLFYESYVKPFWISVPIGNYIYSFIVNKYRSKDIESVDYKFKRVLREVKYRHNRLPACGNSFFKSIKQ